MIALASDHAGFAYKEKIKGLLTEMQLPFKDFGTHSSESTDYPDYAHAASTAISKGECDRGILVCGTGIGMSIVANKHKGIRAAACETVAAAELSRKHNNANVLCIGERLTTWDAAQSIVKMFLKTEFEGGRHERRVAKIHSLTSC
ncbi:MAG TPA: ribose 5-phosphate isomerase B [Bacteroidota bacterium]|nr:ribose 5-phosphate isomerase B [Bacteroidota bacterium]